MPCHYSRTNQLHRRPSRYWSLLLWLLFGLAPAHAVEIILSSADDTPAIRAFADALAVRRPHDQVSFLPLAQMPKPQQLSADKRLILLGTQALDWRLTSAGGPPALVLRVSQVQANQRLGSARPQSVTLLWNDPAPARQLRLIRAVLPQAERIGVLFDDHSAFLLDELQEQARALGLKIIAQRWLDAADNHALLNVLQHSDLLLGVDDGDLFNAQTAKTLLLTSYAQQRALIGPSAGFVRAGSLASIYSDQTDWLASLDKLLDQSPRHWPRSTYPAYFKVLSNARVARALALELPDDATLMRHVARGETR
ncbi:ABC transporter substrate-binding protein [Pseudomonas borbori]